MPAGSLSRVKPAGTTTEGTNTRKVLMCGAPFWSTKGGWSPQSQRLRASLQRHRSQQTDHADHVIGVEVREEQILERERHAVAHHLALRTFSAVEQQRLPLSHERDRGDIAFHRRTRRGRAEQTNGERHGGNIVPGGPPLARTRST